MIVEPVQVLVVDDSAFMRQTLKGMIEEDPLLRVIATARNGDDALEKLLRYKPDVVTLDIVMSGDHDGLQVLHEIMTKQPTPTIMVSGVSDENANYVIEAISSGAFDFISKPSAGPGDIEQIEHELQIKIRQAALSNPGLCSRPANEKGKKHYGSVSALFPGKPGPEQITGSPLVFIGASTGGPKALQTVIPALRGDLPAPVLVVQHMPPKFTKSLAERLDRLSALKVTEAKEGDIFLKGHVYIAPGGLHLQVSEKKDGSLAAHLSGSIPVHGVRPAVDVTLRSFLTLSNCSFIVAILTGMGKDGAEGLTMLKKKEKNVYAIAESEETCIVFGMPKAAIETGKIDEVCALHQIALAIGNQFGIRGAD